MRLFKYILINLAFTGLMVAGFTFDIEGCRNIFAALLWVQFALTVFCFNEKSRESLRKQGRTVSEKTSFFMFAARFVFLSFYGVFFLVALLAVTQFLASVLRYWAFDHKTEVA